MKRKRILAVVMAVLMIVSIIHFSAPAVKAGNSPSFSDKGDTLTIYCWNDEFLNYVEKFMPGYTSTGSNSGRLGNVNVKWVMNTTDVYDTVLNLSFADSGTDVDVFLSEPNYNLEKWANPDYSKSLDSVGITAKDLAEQYDFTKTMASYGGKQYASEIYACGGGMIYNRDIAKEVLGTDDPAKVQEMVSDWGKFEDVAKKMKKSGYRMTPSYDYIFRPMTQGSSTPWVKNNKINVGNEAVQWADLSKRMVKAGQTTTAGLWDTDKAFDENTDFCVFGPSWYYNYCMHGGDYYEYYGYDSIANRGGWAFCEGPQAYYWGGTYLHIAKKTDNPQAAAYLVKMMTTDTSVMTKLQNYNGYLSEDFNNKTVINNAAKNSKFNNPYLGGQNPFAILKDSNKHISVIPNTVYDYNLQTIYQDSMRFGYINGSSTFNKSINNFYTEALNKYPGLSRGTVYNETTIAVSLANNASGVKITWKALQGAAKYRIYKQNSKGTWTKLGTTTELKYIDTAATAGEKSTYSVVGLNSSGSEISAIGNGKSITFIAPAMKTTVKYKATGAAVSWTKLNGAAKYRVFRKVGSGDWTKISTTTSLSYVDKTAVYGKTYSYAVRAMNASGSFVSDMGSGTSFTYFAPAPKVTLSNGTMGVNISWATMTGAAKYRIFVKNSSGAWAKLATVKEGTTYTDTTAKVGKSYTYAVVGMDSAGRLMNDYGKGTTIKREKPIFDFTLKSVAAGVKVSWKAADGAGKYRVYRKNSDGSWATLATIKDGTLFYRDTTAVDGKTYTYAVVAMSAGGTALTDMGDGQKIKYVKPVSEVEVVEAEVTDVDGNVIVYTISDDEITEDFITIVPEDQKEVEETSEEAEAIVEDTDEEISEDAEEVVSKEPEEMISEDNEEESEEIAAEETETDSEETGEEADEENAEETVETVNSEITEEVQE